MVEYRDGYKKVHELREALETIRWGTDYLLACISGPDKIVAMFGSSEVGDPSDLLEQSLPDGGGGGYLQYHKRNKTGWDDAHK